MKLQRSSEIRLKVKQKETMKDDQNKVYADPTQWYKSIVISPTHRLRYILKYANILKGFGLLKNDELKQELNILEPGCGVGSLSYPLSILGSVFSLDYCDEAIKLAEKLFGSSATIKFLEADGTKPDNIPELIGKKFDFILMREFHPITRNIAGDKKPVDIVKNYYNMLNDNGIIIIEHTMAISGWKVNDDILQTSMIIKEFKASVFYTHYLDLMLNFLPFKYKKIHILLSRLFNPIEIVYCFIRSCNLSKTIIIKK